MIPAPFEYARPASLEEALELVAVGDASIRVLAGGQSLIPLMKLRLARPQRLIDLGRLGILRGIDEFHGGALKIGAMTTWATMLADPRVTAHGALADVLPIIGDVQVRNRGTIGGSLVHADPASDIAAVALALGFELTVRSAARGVRGIKATDFFTGPFSTSLAADEILTSIFVPMAIAHGVSAYRALPQPASGYPIAGVAVVVADRCPAVAVTGVAEQPYRATSVEQALDAGHSIDDAVATITQGQRINADIHADREYRAAMAAVMARRAHAAALARAG